MGNSKNITCWVFTLNADSNGYLHSSESVGRFWDKHCREAVFQVERNNKTNRQHYQGRSHLTQIKNKRLNLRSFELKVLSI